MKIASVFSDNMVLQRNRNIRIFGTCTNNEKAITVTLFAHGLAIPARAVVKNGTWEAVLPPVKECSSCTLEVSCGAVKKVFNNVLKRKSVAGCNSISLKTLVLSKLST